MAVYNRLKAVSQLKALFSGLMALILASGVNSAEYRLESNYRLFAEFDDNYRFVSDTANTVLDRELSGAKLFAGWTASRNTGRDRLALTVDTDHGHYSDEAFNRSNGQASLLFEHSRPRSTYTFNLLGGLDSVRDTENQNIDDSAFNVLDASRVEHQSVTISGRWSLTERDSLSLNASVSHRHYESASFAGYLYGQSSLLYLRQLSSKLTGQFRISFAELQGDESVVRVLNPNVPTETCQLAFVNGNDIATDLGFDCVKLRAGVNTQTTLIGQLGFIYKLTERLSLDLLLGPRQVKSDTMFDYANVEGALIQDAVASVNSDGVTQDSFSTDSSLVYRLEKGRLSLDADTSDTVSSNGILLATRRISLAYQQQFSARLSGDIGIAWRDFKQVDEAGDAFAQNEQMRGSLTLRYQLSPEWRLRTTVSTAYRQREGLDEVDDRQAIKLDIAWQPRAWSIAR